MIAGTVGVVALGPLGAAAALGARKRIRCQGCGEYNDTGNPEPWTGPQSTREAAKESRDTAQSARVASSLERQAKSDDRMERMKADTERMKAERKERREARNEEKAKKAAAKVAEQQAKADAPQLTPAGWYNDPQNEANVRWWDGATWTEHSQPRI